MSCAQRTFVFIATILGMAALGIGLTSLLHDRWISITVTAPTANSKEYKDYTRTRGLIWVCVPTTSRLLALKPSGLVYGRCFAEQLGQTMPTNANFNYWYIVILHRLQIGLKSASLFLNTFALLLGFATLLQWCLNSKSGSPIYRRCRGIIIGLWILAALLDVTSMAIFHYYLDLEKYLNLPNATQYFANWSSALKAASYIKLDMMYYFEWGVICLLVLASLILLLSLCLFPENGGSRGAGSGRTGLNDDRTYLYHSNPMMQMSSESLPPYDAYKSAPTHTSAGVNHQDDGQSARSGQSSRRLPRYPTDATYQDNQAKNVYRIY